MAFATWNPADKAASITLSNGDLTASNVGVGGNLSVRSTFAVPSGAKIYLEFTLTTAGTNAFVGAMNATHSLTNSVGTDFNDDAAGYRGTDGAIFSLNVNVNSGYSSNWLTDNIVIGMAWDMPLGAIWFSQDGVWQDGATITEIQNGTTTNAAYVDTLLESSLFVGGSVNNSALTANFGASAFTHTVPTGFEAGLDITLEATLSGAIDLIPELSSTAILPAPHLDGAIDLVPILDGTLTQPTIHADGAVDLAPALSATSVQLTAHADGAVSFAPIISGSIVSGVPHLFGAVDLAIVISAEFERETVTLNPDNEFGIKYYFTMTGAPNSTTDVEIPIRSLQSQFKLDGTSFIQVVIADGATYLPAVSNRPDGEMVIEREFFDLSGNTTRTEIARALFASINRSRGPTSYTLQILGNSTFTIEQSRRIVTPVALLEGTNRIRIPPNNSIRPGDIISFENTDLQVSDVTLNVSDTQSTMDITTQ